MQQLSAHNTRLLQAEAPAGGGANITLLHIYDQRTVPGGVLRFKTVLSRIESRLDRSPVFRRKLQRVPFALDNPYWIDDEQFDLEYHVRHIGLPKPGDWRQFCIQVARLHARPLDLDRPLWELYVIEGLDSLLDLPPGSFAVVTKTHQVAVDLSDGSELTALLHDDRPDAPTHTPAAPWFPRKAPSTAKLLRKGLARAVVSPLRLAAPVAEAMTRQVANLAPAALNWAGELIFGATEQLPPTRFNSVVSARRVFETRRFALEDFKRLRALAEGATVNDCVLAVCGGALRRYLQAHEELPLASLSAVAPISVRGDGDDVATLSWLDLQLATDEASPVRRLARIVEQTQASATVQQAVGARELADASRHAPSATLNRAGRMLGLAQLTQARSAPLAHCSITNVPGGAKPLFLCGARMTWFSAMLPLVDGMGLVIAVTSYDGQLIISPTSCRELMPDPAFFAQCLRESFQELLAEADALQRPVAPAPRARRSKRSPKAAAASA